MTLIISNIFSSPRYIVHARDHSLQYYINAVHTIIMFNLLSDTTRERRENEVDGFDYHFMNCSVREFRQQCDQGLFLEAGMFHDNGYGTKLQTVVASMEKVNNYEPVREKTNNLGPDQVRHKPGYTVTEDD